MRRALLVLGFGLALLIGGAVVLLFASPTSVTVRNDSSQTITAVSVTVQGRRLDFPDLTPGHSARRWFHNTGADDHYSFVATVATEHRFSETRATLRAAAFMAQPSSPSLHPAMLPSPKITEGNSTQPSPNHALQRTAPGVTPPASAAALPPAAQASRPSRPSLSLGSLGR